MAYASYEFYAHNFMGSAIPCDDFPRLSERASEYLDYITRGRAAQESHLPALQKACCALAEYYQVIENARNAALTGEITSQTVGGWSRTYRSGTEVAKEYDAQLHAIAQRYLMATGLLYRGGGSPCFHTL